jgi:hypothetical protein
MQSDIYQNYDHSGDDATKTKLKDLTYQIMKNAVSMVEMAVGAHKIINDQENAEFKNRNAMEQHLINLRNGFLTQAVANNG